MPTIRVMLCIALSTIFAGCGASAIAPANQARNPIVYGLSLEPSGIDPHRNRSAEMGIVLRQVYDTLVYRDPQTKDFVPGLAASWQISADGLIYTFNLRQGVVFHDGTAFNAQAVAANIDRIRDPETQSDRAIFMLGPVIGYDVIDDYTINLLLSQPYSALLDALSQIYLAIASPTALSEYPVERYMFHQVGTGPFIFVEYLPGERIVLRRNTAYTWGPVFYETPTDQHIDRITFRFFNDPPTRTIALESGDAQIVGELPPVDARALTGNSNVQVYPTPIPGQPLQFYFNSARFPTDDLRVRQALLLGTNRNVIADVVYQGFWSVAWAPVSPSTLFYNNQLVGAYSQDTVLAQQLLAEAGYSDSDNNGYLDFGEGDLTVDMIVPNWNYTPDVALLIQDQWRTIGVRINLIPVVGFSSLRQAISNGQYNLVAFNEVGLDPSLLNQYYLSDGASNWSNYSNTQLDDLLIGASVESDVARRESLYGQAQRLIMEQALTLPIAEFVTLTGVSSRLQGLIFDPYGWFPLLNNLKWVG